MQTVRRVVEHRGAGYRLRRELEALTASTGVREYCMEGPRGCGKSNAVAYMIWKLCRKYAQSRVLVIRTARSLLTDTFCKTFEEDVCPGDECVSDVARTNRHEYVWPSNGSRIVLGGLDDANRYYGSDWDMIVLEEAVQFAWKDVEPFLGSLRNGKMPFHALIYSTNPDAPGHWLNRRCDEGLALRYRCHHKDNPAHFNPDGTPTDRGTQFMATLARYTGVAKLRHVDGVWAGAEGQVWENYDPAVHLVLPEAFEAECRAHPDRVPIEYRAAIDWGFTDTGALGVWGIDAKKRAVCVDRVYKTKQNLEWWARVFVMLANEYNITRAVADPSRPDAIELFGDWLVRAGKHRIVFPADNRRASSPGGDLGGLDLVRWGFERDIDGVPRMRFLSKQPRLGVDENLRADGQPFLGYDEIPEYVFAKDSNGDVIGDRTDPKCVDHWCDQTRYMATDIWPRDVTPTPAPPPYYGPNTYAGMVGTPESRLLAKLKRERDPWS